VRSLLIFLPQAQLTTRAQVFAGAFADYAGPCNCLIFTFFAGGILQVAMWSNAQTYGTIIAFAALQSLFGGWFFMLMPAVAAQVRPPSPSVFPVFPFLLS
jgi:MFS family permease